MLGRDGALGVARGTFLPTYSPWLYPPWQARQEEHAAREAEREAERKVQEEAAKRQVR